jgi:hypothetical protein
MASSFVSGSFKAASHHSPLVALPNSGDGLRAGQPAAAEYTVAYLPLYRERYQEALIASNAAWKTGTRSPLRDNFGNLASSSRSINSEEDNKTFHVKQRKF